MRGWNRLFTLLLLLWLGLAASGAAGQGTEAAGDRRDELARVAEALADPDPLQRVANMEAIVRRGDAVQTQFAIKTAFASDDRDLRGLAMRALLATLRQVDFEVALPGDIQRDYDQVRDDPVRARQFVRDHRYMAAFARIGGLLPLTLTCYVFPEATGNIEAVRRGADTFTISGDRLSTRLRTLVWRLLR